MLNEHHQQQVRQEAMQELVAMDSPEAIGALIKRLGVNFRDTIKNEQEKRWVHQTLVEYFSDRAVAPLIEFIRTEYFKEDFPPRAFVGSGPLLFGLRFEMQGIAVKSQ